MNVILGYLLLVRAGWGGEWRFALRALFSMTLWYGFEQRSKPVPICSQLFVTVQQTSSQLDQIVDTYSTRIQW